MSAPELYILRHGETEWNATGRMQGHLNSVLTARGVEQAKQQGRLLAACNLDGFDLVSSPLGRAFQTAAIALGPIAREIRTDADLREIDVGAWSGKLRADLCADLGDLDDTPDGPMALYSRAPGEGFSALRHRCTRFLTRLKRPSVLVTHGITSRMLRAVILDVPSDRLGDLPGGQGVVFHLKDGTQKMLS